MKMSNVVFRPPLFAPTFAALCNRFGARNWSDQRLDELQAGVQQVLAKVAALVTGRRASDLIAGSGDAPRLQHAAT
jgi:hypothetical protein